MTIDCLFWHGCTIWKAKMRTQGKFYLNSKCFNIIQNYVRHSSCD